MQNRVVENMKGKTWLVGLLIVAVITGGLYSYYGQNKAKATAASVKTVAVERGSITAVVAATGTIKPVNMIDISSKITGLIKEMRVQENEVVKAGQVLVVLDDTRLQTQVSQTKERLNNAAANYERNAKLKDIGAVSDQQMDTSRLDYNLARAAFDDAVSQLSETVITSPIEGVVVGKPIPAGQTVAQGISNPMVILTVADMSKMQIETQVDESDIGKISVGQKAVFTFDAYPGRSFSGVVSRVSQKASISQNVVYYGVVIDVLSDSSLLKPSMTARVSISIGENQNVLTLPLAALKTQNNQQYVVVMHSGGKTENVPVTTGLSSEDRIEITSGLSENDQVVLTQIKAQTPTQQGSGTSMPRLPR